MILFDDLAVYLVVSIDFVCYEKELSSKKNEFFTFDSLEMVSKIS